MRFLVIVSFRIIASADLGSRPTLAEVASDADASAVHHFDATQDDADSLGDFDDEFWANAIPDPDQIEDAKKEAISSVERVVVTDPGTKQA